ncbi:acetate kinase [Pirellulales bacterium]|nr:acetate kinase [Pirellulales bacterium]
MKVLVINCGSSSIKYQLLTMPSSTVLAKGMVARIGEERSTMVHEVNGNKLQDELPIADHVVGMQHILHTLTQGDSQVVDDLDEIGAIGHRVVHGGEEFSGSVLITEVVREAIERFADLAPLHNPPNLIGIDAARSALPDKPHVACFDTAFHATIPPVAYTYALPWEIYEQYGVRRYGFHGTSHRFVACRAAAMLGLGKYAINCITCHLGNGCSMAAIREGRSVDTSMGLTPLSGLIMGTRTGDFDPAILFYLADKGYDLNALNTLCNKQSGLLGISGVSNHMRTVAEAAAEGNERAQLAIDIFAYRVKQYIGSYAAVLGKLDAVVFTGGIGENSAEVRAASCDNLDLLGLRIDPKLNQTTAGHESEIQTSDSKVKVLVIATNEELAIAGDTYQIALEYEES